MDGDDWEAIAPIGQYGLRLALDARGRWVVGRTSGDARPMAEVLMFVLPVLEEPYAEINRLTSEHPRAREAPCWDLVVRFALESTSDHWADRALDWLEAGCPAHAQVDVLTRLGTQAGRAQRTRHRARRVWKRAGREGGP